ncbi:uncharacterized protein NPIL_703602 [Nephila pilipes]|uniref:Ciliary microtubule inner protein 2A-C-like domain-containing protein n=1 Tax=Nephila pilipes TaxID=299642 RepID=A0A8X6MV20_NEPPI|nr:uncharacterized protein NPIL_703602 [Nephila pilipes]
MNVRNKKFENREDCLYAGYVPGLKYSFGHTYGYAESRLFKSQHPEIRNDTCVNEKLTPYQPPLRELSSIRKVDDPCIQRNGVHQKISKVDDVENQQRRVQWTDGENQQVQVQATMDIINPANFEESFTQKHAAIQCSLEETLAKDEEREGLRSAATQWSDQEARRKKRYSAATQWSPIDFSALKTIPGYTGHLPGRHYVNPGKTFCQEVDALLTTFHPRSKAVVPLSRYNFTSALQQVPERPPEGKDDPYFDNRPPSTYANNYPIPGYQGFVPRVRTSTSSLGIRYIKAVEKSLHALHEQKQKQQNIQENNPEDELLNSPKKLLDKRPPHTPRHKPHPRQQLLEEEDWRLIYRRPPSTYLDDSKTFIPGYKGFVPHLRGSPNAVGIRYSKAAQRCLLKTFPPKSNRNVEASNNANKPNNNEIQEGLTENSEYHEENVGEGKENENVEQINNYYPTETTENLEEKNAEDEPDNDQTNSLENNRFQRNTSADRPYRQQHSDYLRDRKPSTYRSDERYPIPGYQGFVPRLRDSPTTLGLRYTKAALKTLEDVHRMQSKKD